MRTLILYATKHGATAEIARRIAEQIEGSVTHDLKQSGIPPIAGFDCVVVGSSVYAGMIRKEAKLFLAQNADILCKKKLGLFLSGMDTSDGKKIFDANIPESIMQAASAMNILGGIFDPGKAGFFERLVMKLVTKQSGYLSNIDDEKIKQFAETMIA